MVTARRATRWVHRPDQLFQVVNLHRRTAARLNQNGRTDNAAVREEDVVEAVRDKSPPNVDPGIASRHDLVLICPVPLGSEITSRLRARSLRIRWPSILSGR